MAANEMIAPCQLDDASGTVWRPRSDDVFAPGDRMDIFFRAWPAEGIVPGSAFVCSIFLLSAQPHTARPLNVSVLDHGSFTYRPDPRRDPGDHCEDLNSTYVWTIPADIDVADPEFKIVVVDGVNLGVLAESDGFRILPDDARGGDIATTPVTATLALPGLPEGTPDAGFQSGEGPAEPGARLSTGVRAAMGVGVGILVMALAFGLLLIRRHRLRSRTGMDRLRGKLGHIAELEDSPPRGKDDRVCPDTTKEKVYELPGTPVD